MGFKGIYANKSSATKAGIFFLLIFISVVTHLLFFYALMYLFTDNGLVLIQNQDLSSQESVNYLKLMQLFSGIGIFITPTLLYAYLTNFDFKFAKPNRQNTILVIAIMMLIIPFIGILLEWNMMIPVPEWVSSFDNDSEKIVEAFIKMNHLGDMIFNLVVIAVVPAIGEELLFRGYLQQKFGNWLSNQHTGILITAFLFSAIHFHFQGMIPRFVLGVLLGYLFYWSKTLWLPIIAHFANNAQAVILSYPLFKIDNSSYLVSSESPVDPMMGLFSFMSVSLLLYLLFQNIRIKKS